MRSVSVPARARRILRDMLAMSAAACISLTYPGQARAQSTTPVPDIWFSPLQDHYDSTTQSVLWTYFDFLSMLPATAPWQTAAHKTNLMIISSVHAAEGFTHTGTPSLPAIKATLTRLGVKTGGGGSIVYTDGLCNGGVEGMTNDKGYAREVVASTQGWHAAGMPMDYFVMDGPYYFGHIYTQSTCHFSITDVANRAATTMKMIKALYPNIIVVDAEGPGADLPAQWLPGYHAFLTAFAAAYGKPIDYLDMDLAWMDKWHTGYRWTTAAKAIAQDMHQQGLRVSIYVDADDTAWDPDVTPSAAALKAGPGSMTVDYWMAAVRKHIDLIKQNAIPVDAVDIESWMKFPRHNLPETDPTAMASIVDYAHTVLAPGR